MMAQLHPIRSSWVLGSSHSSSELWQEQNWGPFELLVCVLKPETSTTRPTCPKSAMAHAAPCPTGCRRQLGTVQ